MSNSAQKNDRISFTNQTKPITVEMAPQRIVLCDSRPLDSDCPPKLSVPSWYVGGGQVLEEQDKPASDRTC